KSARPTAGVCDEWNLLITGLIRINRREKMNKAFRHSDALRDNSLRPSTKLLSNHYAVTSSAPNPARSPHYVAALLAPTLSSSGG
ncbi:MAG: hypothetical protein LC778_09695, partial [Acidobacteria bacterium]|nr:hypothetical protein [Acidobacteriota bacterium]